MLEQQIIPSLARIEVQNSFCDACSICIKNELQEIDAITNVRLYPKELLITFHFMKADILSTALNLLSELGYPEKGESVYKNTPSYKLCVC